MIPYINCPRKCRAVPPVKHVAIVEQKRKEKRDTARLLTPPTIAQSLVSGDRGGQLALVFLFFFVKFGAEG